MSRKELSLLVVLAALQFCHILDFMIIMPLGEKLMTEFDISPGKFSWLVSVYAGAAFMASLVSAGFVDRLDRRTALLLAHLGFTVGTLACGMSDDFTTLLVARGVAGAFGGLISTQVLAIVGDYFPFEKRGRAMGIVMMAFSAASVIGVPAGISIASYSGWEFPFLAVGGLALLAGIAALAYVPKMNSHIRSAEDSQSVLDLFKGVAQNTNQLQALAFTIVLMLGHFTVIPFIAPYMQLNLGFSDFQLSLIYAIGGALTVVSLPIIGRLADRYGSAKVFTYGSIGTVACILTVTHLPASISVALVLVVTSSLFITSGGRTVPALTLVTSVVKQENRGGFMSLRSSINQLGMGLASFISGLIITEGAKGHLLNYGTVGWVATAASIAAVFMAWRLKPVD